MSDVALKMGGSEQAVVHRRNVAILSRTSGWYGIWCVIATEGSVFAYLLFSYYYCLALAPDKWPIGAPPPLLVPLGCTILLAVSAAALGWSQWSLAREAVPRLVPGIAAAFGLGLIFLGLQIYDLTLKAPFISKSTYDSFYVLLSALDVLHAAVGVVALAALLSWTVQGRIVGVRTSYVAIIAVYWYFIIVVWLAVFATMILLPHVR